MQSGYGKHGDRYEDESEGESPDEQDKKEVFCARLHGLVAKLPAEPEKGCHADGHEQFRGGSFLQGDAERHRNGAGEHGAWEKHEAGQESCKSEQALDKYREDKKRSVQSEADDEGEHGGDGQILAPAKYREVYCRMLRMQFVPDEGDEGDDGDEGEPGDVGRFKPVFGFSPFEDELKRTDADGEQADACPVDLFDLMFHFRFVHEGERCPGGQQADRNVDKEAPFPGEVVHQPATEQRADSRAEHEAHRKDAGGGSPLFWSEGFVQDCLRGGQECSTTDALDEPEEDKSPDVGGHTAEQRSGREEQDGAYEVVSATEEVAKKA